MGLFSQVNVKSFAFITFAVGLSLLILVTTMKPHASYQYSNEMSPNDFDRSVFDDFDNETGAENYIVPNIIHYIRFNSTMLSFIDYVCIQSAYRNHGPDYFYFHTDIPEKKFHGKFWNLVKKDNDLYSRFRFFHIDLPKQIFGQNLSTNWRLWHGSDVARIQTVAKYGGIYLDNDVFVLQSLDKYRKFEATVEWDEGQYLGNQVIIANRNARVLTLWLATYSDYRGHLW